MKKYLVGVDIGGTSIKIGLFDLDGHLIRKWDMDTNKSDHGSHIIQEIAINLRSNLNLKEVSGIGFGVPGPVTQDIVFESVNLGWKQLHVKEEFLKYIEAEDFNIHVSNDANVAAAGELFQGVAKGYRNMVMITLGTGIGGGIILDGNVIDGVNGIAGEIGHIVVDFNHQLACNCGKLGCLETVSSATGIVNLAKIKLLESSLPSTLRKYTSFSAKKVLDAAKEGDILSIEVIDESMSYLAYAMSLITNVINPEVFVIGGGVSNAGEYLLEKIEKYYLPYVKPFLSRANFVIASLGNDAGIYGAAYMVKP
ncbi:MAG: ROK family glucokinase [Candidatus Izemoplasmatales bacterium]|nr:ROK family glucokinase [Candidatus Izemoplasmatales bacterium]